MESGDRCQVDDSIRPIVTVPEEIMRKIFSYLPFETLYFSLRKVCTKMQSYVDRYIKVGGPTFLVRRQEGSENQEIEITPIPKKGFVFLRKPLPSFISNCSSILQNSTILDNYNQIRRISIRQNDIILDLHGDRTVDKVAYWAKGEMVVCYIYKSLYGLTYRFDLGNEKLEKILENFTTLKFSERPYLWNKCNEPSHECNPKLLSEDFPYHFENHTFGFGNYPFLQVKANDGTWFYCSMMSYERLKV